MEIALTAAIVQGEGAHAGRGLTAGDAAIAVAVVRLGAVTVLADRAVMMAAPHRVGVGRTSQWNGQHVQRGTGNERVEATETSASGRDHERIGRLLDCTQRLERKLRMGRLETDR